MFCKYCGNELTEGASFCGKCGKVVERDGELDVSMVFADGANEVNGARDSAGRSILTFAIVGLALACTFYFAIVGLIFTIIARSKVKRYIAEFGEPCGTAKVGKHLSTGGLVAGIVFSILGLILGAVYIVAILTMIMETGGLEGVFDGLSDFDGYMYF